MLAAVSLLAISCCGGNGQKTAYPTAEWAALEQPVDGTVFCSNKSGYSLITASENELNLHMLDKDGNVLHTVTRTR